VQEGNDEIYGDIEHFILGPTSEGVSRHIFLSSMLLWALFHGNRYLEERFENSLLIPRHLILYLFTEWPRHFALAVEHGSHDLGSC
jgi:hypothetical protein